MKKRIILFSLIFISSLFSVYGQLDGFITNLDDQSIRNILENAALDVDLPIDDSIIEVSLPLPNGNYQDFKVVESPVFGKALEIEYPNISSYLIKGADNNAYHGRLSVSPISISAVFYSPDGLVYVEAEDLDNGTYKSYIGDRSQISFECGVNDDFSNGETEDSRSNRMTSFSNGATLRDYEMIIATTGEFYQANGNTDALVTAQVNNIMSGINVFYENETAIKFTVVAINLNPDPNTDGLDPLGNRTADANSVISAYAAANNINFDIGHVVHTTSFGGSGIAGTGPCTANAKARGWSGMSVTSSIFAWVSLMGHEIGHQFSAAHSYYGTAGNCQNRSAGNGYEPGSGNTVMSYEGICGAHNITPVSSTNYFHEHSLTQIINYAANNATCSTNSSSGNSIPSVTLPNTMTIPISTPFYLKGSATDGDGDPITYCWEQHDTDNMSYPQGDPAGDPASAATIATAPLFRSFDPSPDGNERYFPQLSDVISGTTTQGEILSTISRTITMRLTARDNVIGGGAFGYDDMAITVSATGGAFSLSSPNGGETLTAGNSTAVTWNQASTATYCSNVDILLSTDGGFNYPYTLATSVSNNGTASVNIPSGVPNTSIARIMVRCANDPDAYFFDISDADFSIISDCIAPNNLFTNTSPLTYDEGQTINLNVSPSFLGTVSNGFTGGPFSFGAMGVNGVGGTGCTSLNFNHDTFEFTVDATGTYTISQNPFFCGFSVFNGSSTACVDFLGSSLTSTGGSGFGVNSGSVSVSLTAGSTYTVGVTNTWNSTVAFSGPGDVLTIGSLPTNYFYSYLVVDQSTGLVVDVDAGADFTGLPVGVYDVYGFAYENDGANAVSPPDVDPLTFIGQSLAGILSGGDCVTFSTNSETLEVLSVGTPCPLSYTVSGNENGTGNGSGGQNTDGDYETDGAIISTQTITAGVVDYDSGTEILLNPDFETMLGSIFSAFIDGCGGAAVTSDPNGETAKSSKEIEQRSTEESLKEEN